MIAFAGMLVKPAEEAGMKVPPDPDKFNAKDYPHFDVFCKVQLGASLPSPTAHWDNAKIIAKVPNNEIMKVTFADLLQRGLHIKT